jgi:hypothetical protein
VLSPKSAVRAAVVILTGVIFCQLSVAAGAPWGAYTPGGLHSGELTQRGRIIAGLSVLVLLAMAFALLARIGGGPFKRFPRQRLRWLNWFAIVYSGFSVVIDLATKAALEREIWAPVSIVLFTLVLITFHRTRFHKFL